jgi:hypothetical protein|mmetsp:Transcript_22257/g.37269  ORF Transcript_22257/g.37269 Transcript_22257/m.37269 type:complete len:89 (-) Transcript_22257:107-373(-)
MPDGKPVTQTSPEDKYGTGIRIPSPAAGMISTTLRKPPTPVSLLAVALSNALCCPPAALGPPITVPGEFAFICHCFASHCRWSSSIQH